MESQKRKRGRPTLHPDRRRVEWFCLIAPETAKALEVYPGSKGQKVDAMCRIAHPTLIKENQHD